MSGPCNPPRILEPGVIPKYRTSGKPVLDPKRCKPVPAPPPAPKPEPTPKPEPPDPKPEPPAPKSEPPTPKPEPSPPPAPKPEPPPPEPEPPAPTPEPPGKPTKEKNKTIASLLRALSYTGQQIGDKLSVALGVKESAKVIKDAKFKEFLFNKPTWVNVIDLKEIDEQLKEVESVEPKENAEANLANFILDKYKSNTKIPNPERQFVRVFFDLMCAVSSIYKESLPTVYSAYFKAFMKGNVLKIFSKNSGNDVDEYIVKKLVEYDAMTPAQKVSSKTVIYGGRKTMKRRPNKKTRGKYKKTKRHTR